jgi:hypothetical protein
MKRKRKKKKKEEAHNDLGCVWILYFGNAFLLECILENAFFRMHFAENSKFGKILKLFIRSDYAKRNCIWLVF